MSQAKNADGKNVIPHEEYQPRPDVVGRILVAKALPRTFSKKPFRIWLGQVMQMFPPAETPQERLSALYAVLTLGGNYEYSWGILELSGGRPRG